MIQPDQLMQQNQVEVMTEDADRTETRRGFAQAVVSTLVTLIGGAIAASSGTYLLGRTKELNRNSWADAGEVSGLRQGVPQEIVFDKVLVDGWETKSEKTSAWVILGADGRVAAFSPQCTHLGCPYHWEAERKQFVCPCHGSCFDAKGSVIAGPALRPLDRYEMKMEGSRLWLVPVQVQRKS
jgi:menaquinol-cytochrome c reductase iron-sulfur subunit